MNMIMENFEVLELEFVEVRNEQTTNWYFV
ncbi:Uncharacterised protein [Streptococcus equi subsp. zooepidemicus]|uniref:Uncharacterized protein n=1 Tax=Streptococcus equi subsp. zooepidemicus TaxID=40041 RepID=A0A2X3RSW6_STRSZ|nr:hypothetical protein AT53_01867 [Streptococcus equi subsp. zooepidemicus Sz5]QTZ28604.1 hypothetical protein GDAKBCAL_00066 [Streptococcus equi subsp. zooepidemicus]SQE94984.1 Uncharacterised protein [Streptococcus equi subsp. zooepidemicus]SQF04624.1 Uncharacterised protein [Streptococcus equi subsp. zooepidemicus]SQF53122.1 Uncharacterised protein [Streptococcus equi subsp. zooepidemicus]